jgi:hypothetical protein
VPGSFVEGLSTPITCSGDYLDVTTIVPSPFSQGFQDLDTFFLGSCPFLDLRPCVTYELHDWASSEGFISPFLLPSNINVWHGVDGGC